MIVVKPSRGSAPTPTVALLTGGEANLGFLTRQNPEITNITNLRDIRMAVIDEAKKRNPAK